MAPKEDFFERKNAEKTVDHAAHGPDSPFTPRPNLRGHEIHDGDSGAFQARGDPEMEVGRIRQDGQRGFSGNSARHESAVPPPDPRQVADNFDKSHYREILGPDHRFYTFRAEFRTRASEQ